MSKNIKISKETLLSMYETLLKIRKIELKIEKLYHLDEMKTPVHLCLGQEAVPVGVCANLKKDDYVFSNHRGHGHYIAKGGNLKSMTAELYCKAAGCSKDYSISELANAISKTVGFKGKIIYNTDKFEQDKFPGMEIVDFYYRWDKRYLSMV